MRRSLAMIAIAAAASFGIAACGSDSNDSTSAADTSTTESSTTESTTPASGGGGAAGTVEIAESEYKLDPADPSTAAGSVTFNVTNDGQIAHNFEVEGNGVEEEVETIDPGASGTLTIDDLKPGSYEIYCSIEGHRDLGMEGTLTVN